MGVHPGQADAEAVADPHADRADDEGCQRANDDHAEERHEDQLDAFGDDPLQSVVDESKYGGHEQRHEYVAGIVAQRHRQTEYVGRARLGAQSGVLHARGGLGIHQAGELRGHEDGHDGTTQPWPRIGRKESARYSKKESSQATLPRALERASALTSALLF